MVYRASLEAQLVKNLPAMWGTWVRFLIWEDPLEKGKATHSSALAWRSHSPWGRKESDTTERLSLHNHYSLYKHKCAVCAQSPQSCPTLQHQGLQPTRLLCPWNFPGKNTGVAISYSRGSSQVLNPHLLESSNPRIKFTFLMSPASAGRFFTLHHLGSPGKTALVTKCSLTETD